LNFTGGKRAIEHFDFVNQSVEKAGSKNRVIADFQRLAALTARD
jgi:hypothetical protein